MDEDSSFATVAHREDVMAKVSSSDTFKSAGPRTQLKSWLSWVGATHRLLKHWHTMLLGVSYHLLKNGMDVNDLPLLGLCGLPGARKVDKKAVIVKDDDADSHVGDDDGASAKDDDAGSQVGDDKADKTKDIERDQCKNTLIYVSHLLADLHRNRMMKIVCHASTPVWKAHNEGYKNIRSVRNVHKYNQGMVNGLLAHVIVKTWDTTQDTQILRDMGFSFEVDDKDFAPAAGTGAASSSAAAPIREFSKAFVERLADERFYAERLWKFVRCLVSYRSLYSAHFTSCLPGLFALLIAEKEESVTAGLKHSRCIWEALAEAEQKAADGDVAIRALIKKITWAHQVAVRETLISLAEIDFKFVPKEIADAWRVHFNGYCQSAIVENAGCKLEDTTRLSKNKRVCRPRRLYVPSVQGVMKSYDRQEVTCDEANNITSSRCGPSMFLALGDDNPSIGHAHYKIITQHATWPSPSALGLNMDVFCTQLLIKLHMEEKWNDVANMWRAALICEGLIIEQAVDKRPGLVLQSNDVGVVIWPLTRVVWNGVSYMFPDTSAGTQPFFLLVPSLDLSLIHAWLFTVMSPLEVYAMKTKSKLSGVCVRVDKKVSVLEAAARQGFAGIDVTWLKKVTGDLKLKWAKNMTKHGGLEMLIRGILGGVTDADIVTCLAKHSGVEQDPSILVDDDILRDLDGVMNGEERQECTQQKKEHKKSQGKANLFKAYVKEMGYVLPDKSGFYTKDIVLDKSIIVAKEPMKSAMDVVKDKAAPGTYTLLLPENYEEFMPGLKGATLQMIPSKSQYTARYPRDLPPSHERSRTPSWKAQV
jgi:hypothetical protein